MEKRTLYLLLAKELRESDPESTKQKAREEPRERDCGREGNKLPVRVKDGTKKLVLRRERHLKVAKEMVAKRAAEMDNCDLQPKFFATRKELSRPKEKDRIFATKKEIREERHPKKREIRKKNPSQEEMARKSGSLLL